MSLFKWVTPNCRDIIFFTNQSGLCHQIKMAMSKILKKPVWVFVFATIGIVGSLSLTPTTFCTKLNETEKNKCVQFQLLNGTNRIAEAEQLISIVSDKLLTANEQVKNKTNYQLPILNEPNIQHSAFNIQHYSFSDLKKIFGEPSAQNADGSLTYIYDYTSNYSFTIQYNQLTQQVQLLFNN